MAPTPATKPARKRNRKRKRRNVSSSSSSDSASSSSEESSDNEQVATAKLRIQNTGQTAKVPAVVEESGEDDTDSDTDSSSSEDSDVEMASVRPVDSKNEEPVGGQEPSTAPTSQPATKVRPRPESPPPVSSAPTPAFLPNNDEQVLKDRFRKFWMSNIADAFADDLNVIRNVCERNLLVFHC